MCSTLLMHKSQERERAQKANLNAAVLSLLILLSTSLRLVRPLFGGSPHNIGLFLSPYLIQYFLIDGKHANVAVPMSETDVRRARMKNQHHSSRNILSLIMFRLSTHMAWSTFRLPVKAPEGN